MIISKVRITTGEIIEFRMWGRDANWTAPSPGSGYSFGLGCYSGSQSINSLTSIKSFRKTIETNPEIGMDFKVLAQRSKADIETNEA